MKKLQIKSRKDWFIAFLFTFLILYLIALNNQDTINELLLPLTPDKISFFNQPDDQGVFATAVLAMTVISIGVMIDKKMKAKYMALAFAGGILIAGVIMGSYYYQCHLMLKTASELTPSGVTVIRFGTERDFHENYVLDEETKKQIVSKVVALEPVTKEEAKKTGGQYNVDDKGDEISVSIWYPERHGSSYHIWVSVKDDVIRIHKGHSLKEDPIYQDNGLLEILHNLSS